MELDKEKSDLITIDLDSYLEPENRDSSWQSYELIDYLDNSTLFGKIFFAALVENEGKAYLKDLLLAMNEISKKKLNEKREIDGKTISGVTSGLTRVRNKLGKEPFYDVIENKEGLYLEIKDQYGDMVKTWIKSKEFNK